MKQKVFNLDKYLKCQSEKIIERINLFGGKLYLEFGGKLFDDAHANRILPGFAKDSKLQLLLTLKDKSEMIIAISALDIINNKKRADHDILYEDEVLRLIESFKRYQLKLAGVVITQFQEQASTRRFIQKLESLNVKTYLHYTIESYPNNVNLIISEEGFGKNDYVEVEGELVVVTAPGPGSGKLSVCLSQLYHEQRRNVKAGYAKFETFPVHDLHLKDPINLAYEAATADLNDINMIDPFHLEKYGTVAINYNRDIEAFPLLDNLLTKILRDKVYYSPTDMGVNMLKQGIIDLQQAHEYSKDEIVRRYYHTLTDYKMGYVKKSAIDKIESLMSQAKVEPSTRKVVTKAHQKAEKHNGIAVAIELPDGTIITGRETTLLTAASSCIINCLKHLNNIAEDMLLIAPSVLEPMLKLKKQLNPAKRLLSLEEILIALAITANSNTFTAMALSKLDQLSETEAHSTILLNRNELKTFKLLNINLTCDDVVDLERII